LRDLASAFKFNARPEVPCAALTGIAGAGKTQLASEFAHRYGRYFDGGVFWLGFGEPSAVAAEIAACGGAGRMDLRPDFATLSLEDRTRLVMSAWQSELPRLVIFDNCEDEDLAAQWRPPTGGSRILLTSRRRDWDPALGITCVSLETLERAESVTLLRRYRDDLLADDPAVAEIAAELGDLPLALHLAGSYLWRYRDDVTAADYSAQLRGAGALLSHRSLTEGGISPTGHEQHVARSFAISYERLDRSTAPDARAAELLARAAHLAPGEVIPRELVADAGSKGVGDARKDRLELTDATRRLVDLGLLLTVPGGGVRLHRLVALYVRAAADVSGAREAVCARLLAIFSDLHERGLLLRATELEPHLHAVTDQALAGAHDKLTRDLCRMLGSQLRQRGDAAASVPYLEAALACAIDLWGADAPELALDLNDLGASLMRTSALEQARECLEAALPRWHALGNEPNLAATLDNLGQMANDQGDSAAAEAYFADALAIRERVLGRLHPQTAITLTNVGQLLLQRGDLEQAIEYFERSLEARCSTLGEVHHATGISLFNLSAARHQAGDTATAKALLERALRAYRPTLGEDHPRTLNAVAALMAVIDMEDEPELAQELLARLLTGRARIVASGSPLSGMTLNNIGFGLWTSGDFALACEAYLEALHADERTKGVDHPDLVTVLNNLGMAWHGMDLLNDADEAYARAERILARSKAASALSARVANNHGALLTQGHDLEGARARLEEAYEWRRTILGGQHSDTATSLSNLGELAAAEGDTEEGCDLTRQAVTDARRSRNHRTLARCLHQHGVVALHADALHAARASLSEAAELRHRWLPSLHPDIASTLVQLAAVREHLGDYTAAREHLAEALTICDARLGKREGGRPLLHRLGVQAREALARLDTAADEHARRREAAAPRDLPCNRAG
jgi:tetratricopeptide (TPR) repeat protein